MYTKGEDGTKKTLTVKKLKSPPTSAGHIKEWQEEIKKIYYYNGSRLDLADRAACATWIPGVTIRAKRGKIVRDYTAFLCWEEGVEPSNDGDELSFSVRAYVLDVESTDTSVEITVADNPYDHLRIVSTANKLTENNALTGGFKYRDDAWLVETKLDENGEEEKVAKRKLLSLAKVVKDMELVTLANEFAAWIDSNGGWSSEARPRVEKLPEESPPAKVAPAKKKATTKKKKAAVPEEVSSEPSAVPDQEEALKASYIKCQSILVKFKELKSASEQLQSAEKSLKNTRLRLQNSRKTLKEVSDQSQYLISKPHSQLTFFV
jgi:hypothetical protein